MSINIIDKYISDAKLMRDEGEFHILTFKFLCDLYPKMRPFLFHCPNEGKRDIRYAMKLKAMGVRRGIPDVICIHPKHLFVIELKFGRNTLSKDQKKICDHWVSAGIPWLTTSKAAEVVTFVDKQMRKPHEG